MQFSPPHNRYNSQFFGDKPTRRLVTSQNPYAEKFIGQPFVYTIDISNSTEVGLAMRKIMKTSVSRKPTTLIKIGLILKKIIQFIRNLRRWQQWWEYIYVIKWFW